LSKQVSIWAAK